MPPVQISEWTVEVHSWVGADVVQSVTWTTTVSGVPLPYGMDRLLYLALVTVACRDGKDFIQFDSMAELIDLATAAGFQGSGGSLANRVKDTLDRLAGVHLKIEEHRGVRGMGVPMFGDLLSRIRIHPIFQIEPVPEQFNDDFTEREPDPRQFRIRFSATHWKLIQGRKPMIMVPSEWISKVTRLPYALSALLYFSARCQAAQSNFQFVEHHELCSCLWLQTKGSLVVKYIAPWRLHQKAKDAISPLKEITKGELDIELQSEKSTKRLLGCPIRGRGPHPKKLVARIQPAKGKLARRAKW